MRIQIASIIVVFLIAACGQQNNTPVNTTPQTEVSTIETKGREIFQLKCVACHAINTELVGPAMVGAKERWNDKNKLYEFIRNAPKVINEDKYANDLWLKYNKTMMTPFPELTDQDIDAIFVYVDAQKK